MTNKKKRALSLVTEHGDLRVFPEAHAVIGREVVHHAHLNGDIAVYTGFDPSGKWVGTCAKLTVKEARELASALLRGARLVDSWRSRIAGEDKYKVTREGVTYFVTHRRETFPLRSSTFRATTRYRRREGVAGPALSQADCERETFFKRSCASCRAAGLTEGYVVVHEKWEGPRWKDIALCRSCVAKADEAPAAGLRVVDPP